MSLLADEIAQIPFCAQEALLEHARLQLPKSNVPYLGMGSSYYAPLTLRYCGAHIDPQLASEYFSYFNRGKRPLGVLLSQSGESSETLWCRDLFDTHWAIVNDPSSTLATTAAITAPMHAGDEQCSSTKSYINTLVLLYLGLGFDPAPAVRALQSLDNFTPKSDQLADRIIEYLASRTRCNTYVIGAGPNVATAAQSALVLSETLKSAWVGMSVAQFDHGPKEAANDSVVLILDAHGREAKRLDALRSTLLARSNALVVDVHEAELDELLSPFTLFARVSLLMSALAERVGAGEPFAVGGKVTTVGDDARPVQ